MKKILLSSLLVFTTLNAFDISLTKKFTSKVAPKSLGLSVSVNVRDNNLNSVLNKLTEYSDFIKSFKELNLSGGNFNTNPQYKYYNNQREKIGYQGHIYFQIKSKNSVKLKEFVSMLSAKNSQKNVDISISSSSWQVIPKDIEKKKDELRLEAISWANTYAKELSSKLSTECKVKKIDFSGFLYPRPPVVYAEAVSVRKDKMPVPTKKAQKFSLNPRFVFECR